MKHARAALLAALGFGALSIGAPGAHAAWDCGAPLQRQCARSAPTGPDGALPVESPLTPLPAPVAGQPLWPRVNGHVPVGFNETSVDAGYLEPSQAAAFGRGIGGVLVRIPFSWAFTQARAGGPLDWGSWDWRYRAYVRAGIRPIWAIQASPQWAVDDVSACPLQLERAAQALQECLVGPAAGSVSAYASLAAAVARRYPLSAAVEVWNEPNLDGSWRHPDPFAYARLVQATANAVHAVVPDMRVLAGALAFVRETNGAMVSSASFLSALQPARGLLGADALSIHAYPGWPDLRDFTGALKGAADGLASAPEVRVVADEVGVSVTPPPGGYRFSSDEQRQSMLRAFQLLDQPPAGTPLAGRVDGVVFHTDIDSRTGGYGWATPLLGQALPRPVYCAFSRMLGPGSLCVGPLPLGQ